MALGCEHRGNVDVKVVIGGTSYVNAISAVRINAHQNKQYVLCMDGEELSFKSLCYSHFIIAVGGGSASYIRIVYE